MTRIQLSYKVYVTTNGHDIVPEYSHPAPGGLQYMYQGRIIQAHFDSYNNNFYILVIYSYSQRYAA